MKLSFARRVRYAKLKGRRLRLQHLEPRQLLAAGADLAFYEFANHTTATPELFSVDTHAQTTASDINSPLGLGWTGNGEPPNGLALGGAFNETSEPTPAGGQDDYFELTITPDPGYVLNLARFSMQIRRNDPDSKDSYSVYFDNDPGPGGDNFTTKLASGKITSEDVFESISIPLEDVPGLADQTTPITFRVYAWGTVGLNAMRLDNIRVQEVQRTVSESSLAYYGDAGRLLHPLDAFGNRIVDFSAAGYRNSNEPLPDVTATIDPSRFVTVAPVAGDDMASLQAAIDQVGSLPVASDGYRGVVQLTAGEYQISDRLTILDSGVVLRGVGDGDDPLTSTILRATGTTQRSVIVVGRSSGFASGIANTTHNIVDKYVPVGATSLRVDSTANWSVGDPVVVKRPSTAEWITAIGMDNIPPRSDGGTVNQWAPGGNFDHLYERVITRIEGDRVFLNAPLMSSFQQEYGGGTVFRYTFPRIENVGIENIRGVSDFVSPTDEAHASTFIELQSVQDAWVRNVTGQHFIFATVHATSRAIRVTVDDAQSLDPVSIITGARRYPFTIDGQFVLMQNLYSENGRHDFVNNSSWRNRGPNVFLNGTAVDSHSSTGPHQRWSSGTLYDTITTDNLIEARNRGNFGSGHGWGGASMVFWNARAEQFIVQNPQTAQNWVIGSTGTLVNETRFGPQPPATVDAHATPIDFGDPQNPTSSLFVAQHNQRMADPTAETREYVLGDFDSLTYDGSTSADSLPVDPQWMSDVTTLAAGTPIRSSDQVTDGQYVTFRFQYALDTHEVVRSAVLSLGLRGTGGATSDDSIWIDDLSRPRSLGSLGITAPLSTSETTTLTVELTGRDLIAAQDGQLDVLIGQHSAVDWAVLNLSVTELDVFDFGDAPASYPTTLAQDGARHGATGPRLGETRDEESDGVASAGADADLDDGVLFGAIRMGHPMAGVNIDLQNAAEAKVDVWVDFDFDGTWQPNEQVLSAAPVSAGLQTLNYNLPASAPLGQTIARVRLSSVGGLQPTGFAFDGEVEDYPVIVQAAVAPDVESIVINDGQPQRSRVDRLTVKFDSEVETSAGAFSVRDRATGQQVDLSLATEIQTGKTVATLTFLPGPAVVTRATGLHSLRDGNYELTVIGSGVTFGGLGMDGDVSFGDQAADAFFRHFGDTDGDRDVDGQDYGRFGLTFLRSPTDDGFREELDFDGDGDVDGQDYGRFGQRFLKRLEF
ncbi:GEVED domain-containing protein [Planctomycetes bacterium TBK1r]|uniref:GEVED domain-containing protein n=1 Tax=Stieleria magnilauensis TaxID=2527963 RepID=A0ABX5XQL2_9BACT|nr:hypothetical protein TBK1r_32380 [Planctomycetes bacterium TBK1r]